MGSAPVSVAFISANAEERRLAASGLNGNGLLSEKISPSPTRRQRPLGVRYGQVRSV